jgi:hypothetical protein
MTRGRHKDAFVIEEPHGSRFDLALERFLDGNAFEFKQIAFAIDQNGTVRCSVDSSWASSAVTADTARKDLAEGQHVLEELLISSEAFRAAVQGRAVRYDLIEDYGMGSILICSRTGNELTWAPGFPPTSV